MSRAIPCAVEVVEKAVRPNCDICQRREGCEDPGPWVTFCRSYRPPKKPHTEHCRARRCWGDGECECGADRKETNR